MIGLNLSAQSFEKRYEVSDYSDVVTSIYSDSNLNAYITVVGTKKRTDSLLYLSRTYLLKVDSSGKLIYKKELKAKQLNSNLDSLNDIALSVTIDNGSGFTHFGSIRTNTPYTFSAINLKTDYNFKPIQYNLSANKIDTMVQFTTYIKQNQDLTLYGGMFDGQLGGYYGLLYKYQADSLVQSIRLFNSTDTLYMDYVWAALQDKIGNSYLFSDGYTYPNYFASPLQLIKLNPQNKILRKKYISYPKVLLYDTDLSGTASVQWETDTSFILAIANAANFSEMGDVYLFKYDTTFKRIGYQRLISSDTSLTSNIESLVYDSLCDCYYFGVTQRHQQELTIPFNQGDTTEFRLIKFNHNLQVIWDRYYRTNTTVVLDRIISDARGNILMTGSIYDSMRLDPFDTDIYLLKVDSLGNLKTKTGLTSTNNINLLNYRIFPNPAKEKLNFIQYNIMENYQLKLFDSYGRIVGTYHFQQSDNSIDISNLSKGYYVYQLTDSKGRKASGKIVKQ